MVGAAVVGATVDAAACTASFAEPHAALMSATIARMHNLRVSQPYPGKTQPTRGWSLGSVNNYG